MDFRNPQIHPIQEDKPSPLWKQMLLRLARSLRIIRPLEQPFTEWVGYYTTWEDALAESSGWDCDAQIIEMTTQAASDPAQDWDYVEYDYRIGIVSALLAVSAIRRADALRVVDFGGGVGAHSYHHHPLFDDHTIEWTIVEQPALVPIAQERFSREHVTFIDSLTVNALDHADVILFSGSLTYLEDPLEQLDIVNKSSVPFLLFDQLHVQRSPRDDAMSRIAVQIARWPAATISYPIHVFNLEQLKDYLANHSWQCVSSWNNDVHWAYDEVAHIGALYRRQTP